MSPYFRGELTRIGTGSQATGRGPDHDVARAIRCMILEVPELKERRRGARHGAYLAAEVVVDPGTARIAITKDISETGLSLLTRAALSEGQLVTLRIHRPGEEDPPLELSGRVVRREPLSRQEIGTWREKVAFAFDQPQADLAAEFAALVEKQSIESTIPPPPDADKGG